MNPEEAPQPPKENALEPSLLSLGNVKCDRQMLYKVRSDGTRVLEFPLKGILELRYESRFVFKRLLIALAWAIGALICYLVLEIPWIQWPLVALGALVSFGTLVELHDRILWVRTGDGEFVIDLEDSESEYDSRAFARSIEFRLQESQTKV